LKVELAIFSLNPATPSPTLNRQPRPGKFIFQHFSVNVDQVSSLNFLGNGRQQQFFGKWKMTASFWQTEDNLNIFENGR
jgi:hypothetical protein